MRLPTTPIPKPLSVALGLILLTSGCAVNQKTGAQSFAGIQVSEDPCSKTGTLAGAFLGGAIGAVVGRQMSDSGRSRAIITTTAITIGALIGRDVDRRRCELFKIAKKYDFEVSIATVNLPEGPLASADSNSGSRKAALTHPSSNSSGNESAQPSGGVEGLTISVRDSGQQFEIGSDQLLPKAGRYFSEVAAQYSYDRQIATLNSSSKKEDRETLELLKSKRILLVGHTDDVGNSQTNADLSERRALAVAKVFRDHGIPDAQIFYQGAGETLPVGDNHTDTGRSQNRRVEIVDVTDDAAFKKFLAYRSQRLDYYRPASSASGSESVISSAKPASTTNEAQLAGKQFTDKKGGGNSSTLPRLAGPSAARSNLSARTPEAIAFDFGGVPSSTNVASADFGREIVSKPGFALISSAFASNGAVVPSCNLDRPRISNGVKSLRNQKDISITEYMPGLYRTSWSDMVNNHLVGLSNVAVLRDGGAPANRPNLFVYKDYKSGGGAKPDYSAQPEVNAYRGDKAILYRVFVEGPMKCMDLIFPYDNSGEARNSNLFYEKQNDLYMAGFRPKIAR